MTDELRLQGYREPLGLWSRRAPTPDRYPEVRAYHFEYSSRGDRVAGRLWLPRGEGSEHPLVLVAHGANGSSESPYIEGIGGPVSLDKALLSRLQELGQSDFLEHYAAVGGACAVNR